MEYTVFDIQADFVNTVALSPTRQLIVLLVSSLSGEGPITVWEHNSLTIFNGLDGFEGECNNFAL